MLLKLTINMIAQISVRPPSTLDEELMIQNFHTNQFTNLQVKYIDNKIQDARQTIGLLKPKA